MNKNTKIIIIGFGSIGQRHYKNLLKLGFKNIFIYDSDKTKTLNEKNVLKKISLEKMKQFNIAFICNPNNAHISSALLCAKAGCHLFIEKPLSHNLKNIKKLSEICRKKKLISMVGCNMRFNPCLKFIKNCLSKNKLEKIYSIHFDTGFYLPYWRPNQDYRKNYAAKKSTGGGMILDGIHSFDLIFWFNNFINAKKTSLIFDKTSDLEIETEDNFIASFIFDNKVLGSIRGDYLQKSYSWSCKIIGKKGNLTWDFKENSVWLHNEKGHKKLFEMKDYDFNNPYIDEIKYFLNCVEKKHYTFNDIETGLSVLRYCLKK